MVKMKFKMEKCPVKNLSYSQRLNYLYIESGKELHGKMGTVKVKYVVNLK